MGKKGKRLLWKPVHLTEDVVSKGIEDLVGIEELVDYDVGRLKGNRGARIATIKPRKKKKKNLVQVPVDQNRNKISTKPGRKNEGENHVSVPVKRQQEFLGPVAKKQKIKHEPQKQEWCVYTVSDDSTSNDEEDQDESNDLLDKMAAWNGLYVPQTILKALAENNFTRPTEIQALTLPPAIMGRRDILGAAETGSGKTLAFGIPILCRILEQKNRQEQEDSRKAENISEDDNDDDDHGGDSDNQVEEDSEGEDEASSHVEHMGQRSIGCVRVVDNVHINDDENEISTPKSKLYSLVLTPTRELALQISSHLKTAAKYTGIHVATVVGGMATQKQERLLSKGPEIVVATPGRLWELIQYGNPHLSQVKNICCLAIDETDRMVEKGHFQELQSLLELLNTDERCKKQRQNFVFSATLTMVHDPPKRLKGRDRKLKVTPGQKLQSIMSTLGITNPKVIDVTKESGTAGTLTEARITCALEEKDFYLYYFLQKHPGRTLVFCNSITCVRRLTQLLTLLQCRPLPLHANMPQRQRLKNLDRFRDNPNSLLLATDVAARGLDIPGVQHVIHYQVPRTSETYVHRSGRTARAHSEGLTLLLIEPAEMSNYTRLCQNLGRTKDLPIFPVTEALLSVVKERVQLARELDQIELVMRRSNSEKSWFKKTLSEMDMLVDDDDDHDLDRHREDDEEAARRKQLASSKRKELSKLLSRPLFPKGFSSKYPFQQPELILKGKSSTQNSANKDAIQLLKSTLTEKKPKKRNKKKKKKKKGKKKTGKLHKV